MDACQDLGLSASDLVLKWEVYSDMRGLDGPPKPEQIEAIKREVRNRAFGGRNVGPGGDE